jgi:urease accessory protein
LTARIPAGIAAASVAAAPGAALAHSTIEGIDAVYGGLLHPYFVPEHILALTALSLLVGGGEWRGWRRASAAWLAALTAGLGLGAAGVPPWQPAIALLALAMLCGAAAAFAFRPADAAKMAVAALVGVSIGLDSVPEDLSQGVPWQVLGATAIGAGVFPLYVGALLIRFRRPWLALGQRIAGSWAVAIAAMVLALNLFGGAAA